MRADETQIKNPTMAVEVECNTRGQTIAELRRELAKANERYTSGFKRCQDQLEAVRAERAASLAEVERLRAVDRFWAVSHGVDLGTEYFRERPNAEKRADEIEHSLLRAVRLKDA